MGYQPLASVLTRSGQTSDCFIELSTTDNCSHLQLPHSNHCLTTINRQLWQTGGSAAVAAWECLGGGPVVTAGLSFAQCWEQLCSKWLRDPLQPAGCDDLWLCPTHTRQQSSWGTGPKPSPSFFWGGRVGGGGEQTKEAFCPRNYTRHLLVKTPFGFH